MAATQNFGNMTDLEKVERHRASFNENIAKMQEAVSKNSKFLTRADHDRKVARLLALNNVEEKATLSDMNLTRSLAVLNIESNGNLVQKLVKRGTNLRLQEICKCDGGHHQSFPSILPPLLPEEVQN